MVCRILDAKTKAHHLSNILCEIWAAWAYTWHMYIYNIGLCMCVYCICIRANTHAYRRLQKYGKSVGERMCFAVSGSEHAATHEESDCYQRQPPSLCARPFGRYSSLGRLGMAWPNLAISCNFAVAFTIFSYFFLSFFLTDWPMAPLGRLWLWDRDMARKIRKTDEN